ncbi:hypothetical protein TrLO_g2319 [Triparma laevis f. longispina]|uniref:Uncharacterized protein n=1 Tax=Triparma laevis f. longispina TaxID=1714387 RepID=A0A9W7CCD4_9STRA|nr:hypothetical protein TrLO_g2319 [Triparma laevis f. longispina]
MLWTKRLLALSKTLNDSSELSDSLAPPPPPPTSTSPQVPPAPPLAETETSSFSDLIGAWVATPPTLSSEPDLPNSVWEVIAPAVSAALADRDFRLSHEHAKHFDRTSLDSQVKQIKRIQPPTYTSEWLSGAALLLETTKLLPPLDHHNFAQELLGMTVPVGGGLDRVSGCAVLAIFMMASSLETLTEYPTPARHPKRLQSMIENSITLTFQTLFPLDYLQSDDGSSASSFNIAEGDEGEEEGDGGDSSDSSESGPGDSLSSRLQKTFLALSIRILKATSALTKHLPPSATSKSDLLLVGLLTHCFAKLPACPLASRPSLTTKLLSVSHALRVDHKDILLHPRRTLHYRASRKMADPGCDEYDDCFDADFQSEDESEGERGGEGGGESEGEGEGDDGSKKVKPVKPVKPPPHPLLSTIPFTTLPNWSPTGIALFAESVVSRNLLPCVYEGATFWELCFPHVQVLLQWGEENPNPESSAQAQTMRDRTVTGLNLANNVMQKIPPNSLHISDPSALTRTKAPVMLMLNAAMNYRDLSRQIQDMVLGISTKLVGGDKTAFFEDLIGRAPLPLKALLLNLCKKGGEGDSSIDCARIFTPFIEDMNSSSVEDFEKLLTNREVYCEAAIYLCQHQNDEGNGALVESIKQFKQTLSLELEKPSPSSDEKWQLQILVDALDRIS